MLIIDTGVLVAAADRSDSQHNRCAPLVADASGQMRIDHRHFTVVRPDHTDAFTFLP